MCPLRAGFLRSRFGGGVSPLIAVILIVLALGMGYPALKVFVPRNASRSTRTVPVAIGIGLTTGLVELLFLWLSLSLVFLPLVWIAATVVAVRHVRRGPSPVPVPEEPAPM